MNTQRIRTRRTHAVQGVIAAAVLLFSTTSFAGTDIMSEAVNSYNTGCLGWPDIPNPINDAYGFQVNMTWPGWNSAGYTNGLFCMLLRLRDKRSKERENRQDAGGRQGKKKPNLRPTIGVLGALAVGSQVLSRNR